MTDLNRPETPSNDTPGSEEQYDVVLTRIFDAPVEQVWNAWRDPDLVQGWWGPKGWTCPIANMDFREGGVSLVCMRAPVEYGGQEMYNTWTYRAIEPHNRLEFILNFTDQKGVKFDPAQMGMPPGIPQDVHHVITFRALGGGRSEMTVTEYGYTSEEVRDLSKAGMEECLDKMAEILQ